jgi:hypothetical protein
MHRIFDKVPLLSRSIDLYQRLAEFNERYLSPVKAWRLRNINSLKLTFPTEGAIMTFSQADFCVIAALDLDPIKVKLMHEESGEGWSLAQAEAVESEYRRFLYLMKKFPEERAAPRVDVDIFWHYHILDTIKYARDCQAVFGYFLHHFPYVGLRGMEDLVAHQRVGERMRELYEETFDEPFLRGAVAKKSTSSPTVSPTGFTQDQGRRAISASISATAWSLSLGRPAVSESNATAWSLSPGRPAVSESVSATAWSLSLGRPAVSESVSATAWSLSLGRPAVAESVSATAWSLSLGRPAVSESVSATAWSLSPGIEANEVPQPPASQTEAVWNQHSAGFLNVRPSLPAAATRC